MPPDRNGSPTLLISSLGLVPDVARMATMDLKHPGNRLYAIGETRIVREARSGRLQGT